MIDVFELMNKIIPLPRPGFIYVIKHDWIDPDGHVKVGKTTRDLAIRLNELKVAAALPCPYEVIDAYLVSDTTRAELLAHQALSKQRVGNSEWFMDNRHDTWRDDGHPILIVSKVVRQVLHDAGLLRRVASDQSYQWKEDAGNKSKEARL